MKVEDIPSLPSREQEIEYMNFLEQSIKTDPWITLRPKKHMANPWRLHWKKLFEQRREYYKTFALNFSLTITLCYPLIFYLAGRRQYSSSGVPTTRIMPRDLFTPKSDLKLSYDYIRNKYIRRTFQYGLLKYSFLLGVVGAYLFTDSDYFTNDLNGRPDLGQFRIMTGNVSDKERKVFEIYGDNYFGKSWEDKPDAWYKRLNNKLFPSVNYNPPSSHYLPFYDYKRGYYPSNDVSNYYSG